MGKILVLFLFLSLNTASIDAQSTIVPKVITDSTFLLDNNEQNENVNSPGFAKDVLSDTSINFSNFSVPRDSILALKLKREYSWTTNIDSFLLAQKKEDSQQLKIVTKQHSGSSFLGSLFNSIFLQTLLWCLAAAFVLFIIYKLFLSEGIFSKQSVKTGINLQTDEDDTLLLNDYEVLLRKAYGEGNWRVAMRFLFLNTLQKLNNNGMINYAVDKTNSAYVKELPDANKNDFASLSLYYEYVWYGNVEIEKTVFDSIEKKFNIFLNKI